MEWLGCCGSWLLVIGSLYQAAIELRDHEMTGDRFARIGARVPPPAPVSVWWWFLPPVRLLLLRSRRNAYVRRVVDQMTTDDVRDALGFYEKALAWLIIAGGGTTLAVKETLSIPALSRFGAIALVLAMAVGSVGFVIVQLKRRARAIRKVAPGRGHQESLP